MESLIKERFSLELLTLKKDGQSTNIASEAQVALACTSLAMSPAFTDPQLKL
jgi:hypothetical protein